MTATTTPETQGAPIAANADLDVFGDMARNHAMLPARAEFWSAIHRAQSEARALEKRNDGPPDKKAKKIPKVVEEVAQSGEVITNTIMVLPPMWKYVSCEQYLEEWRRVSAITGLVLVQDGRVRLGTSQQGSRATHLEVTYYVVHAETSQGTSFRCDFPLESGSGNGPSSAAEKAYTKSISYFIRGFLAIPRVTQKDEEYWESPPAQVNNPAPGQFNMVAGAPQQGPPPPMQQGQPPQQGQAIGPNGPIPPSQRPQGQPPMQSNMGPTPPPFQTSQPEELQLVGIHAGQPEQPNMDPPMQQNTGGPGQPFNGPPNWQPTPLLQGSPFQPQGSGPGGPGPAPSGPPPQGPNSSSYGGGPDRGPQQMVGPQGFPAQGQSFPQGPPQGVNGGGQVPIMNEPIVNSARQILGGTSAMDPPPPGYVPGYGQTYGNVATAPPPVQQRQQQFQGQQQPPAQPAAAPFPEGPTDEQFMTPQSANAKGSLIRGTRDNEPSSVEGWVELLAVKGWDDQVAIQIATSVAHKPDAPIPDLLKEQISSTALKYYDSDHQRVLAAWDGTGFVPADSGKPRIRPTSLQLMRFMARMDLSSQKS